MKAKISNIFIGDRGIWVIIFFLSLFSLLSVYSAAGQLAFVKANGNTTYYLFRQGFILLFSISVIVLTSYIPYKYFSRLSLYMFYISICLLVFTLFFGMNVNDARRWILLPGGITFQTSDFAKVALLMYLSRAVSIKGQAIDSYKSFFKLICVPIFLTAGLIMPANLSTAVLIFGVSVILLFYSNIKFKYLASLIGLVVLVAVIFFFAIKTFSHVGRFATWNNRIESFFDKSGEKVESSQERHSKAAIATGGLTGKGPGQSGQRNVIPHAYSDYIYAIIVEEFGLIGGVIILVIYLSLFQRGIYIAKRAKREFGGYAVMSLTTLIVVQAFANIAVATNIIPVTGQPLPFVSYGGTSILFIGMAFGIILSVSRDLSDYKKEEIIDESSVGIDNNAPIEEID